MAMNETKAFEDRRGSSTATYGGQNWAHPIYGIVAVDRLVKFYQLVGDQVVYWRGTSRMESTMKVTLFTDVSLRLETTTSRY